MSLLTLKAGPNALARLKSEGLRPALFDTLVGASGGPKWFVLYGLDRFLFGEFFKQARLSTIGSSAGAWRLACLATHDPVAAIDRLADLYSREDYSADPNAAEVTSKARAMLQAVLGPEGDRQLADNELIATHIIVNRCRGPLSTNSRKMLATGLGLAAASNVISRRLLGLYLERVVFSSHDGACAFEQLQDLPTRGVRLSGSNVFEALLASGSIPLLLEGVRDIAGGPAGLYVDGGITDYHFDLPFRCGDGLVLYPHFYPWIIPGWFDKHIPWRRVDPRNYDNVLLVAPSKEFVRSLPYGKIPDRDDFKRLDYAQRVACWQTVLDASRRLADEFIKLVDTGAGLDRIRPFDPSRGY